MSDYLLSKYIGFISPRLHNFRRKGPNLYNFSCPLCDDLKNHPHQGRAYIYEKKNSMYFHCHYCTAPIGSAENFIKTMDANLFHEYLLEKYREEREPKQVELETFTEKLKKPVFLKSGPLKGLKKISQLSPYDRTKKFVVDRMIPNPYHAKLFNCPNFMTWTNTIVPNKFEEKALIHDEVRLLIPFFDKNKNLHAFQGRSLRSNSKVKYITIILNEDIPKLYGLDELNEDKDIIVFEGPIDSFFIDNSVASAGGDLVSSVKSLPKDKVIICYDNEPRSRETIKKIEKAIYNGYRVCIWPENFHHKDINDAVIAGLSSDFIKHIILTNSYKDLVAKTKLSFWSKI